MTCIHDKWGSTDPPKFTPHAHKTTSSLMRTIYIGSVFKAVSVRYKKEEKQVPWLDTR